MSRVDELKAEYDAALAVAKLEDELLALKASGKKPDRLRDVKLELREARRVHRLEREGEGVAAPAAIKASATVKEA